MENVKWIACPAECVCPIIRKTFTLNSPSVGSISVTGLGFFTLYINGKRVSDELFVPALTDYEARDMSRWSYPLFDITTHRIFYLSYDLTPFLVDGENTLELHLGPGWYRQEERYAEGPMSFGKELKAWFCAEFSDSDGKKTLCSDGTELCYPSQITYSNLFVGEIIDARISPQNEKPLPVSVIPAPDAIFEKQTCPSDRVIRTITPKQLHTIGSRQFYDAGESVSGRVCVTAGGKPGAEVKLRFADELTPEGELDCDSTGGRSFLRGSGRFQIQQDTFICGEEKTVFAPEYTWHAFRYIEIEGEFDDITVEVIHTDVPVISSFESSSPALNWLYDAYVRTQLDNLHNCIPSDCPHRERLGYTGDGQITAKTAMLTLDMRGAYKKWIRDILDCQDVINGHVQHTAPAMGGGGGPGGWGCAIVIVPDEYDRHYDDKELLSECYPHMVRWISYLKSHSVGGIVTREEDRGWCLGDWATLHKNRTSARFVNTCYLLDSLRRMIRIANELGHTSDAKAFAEYDKIVRKALVNEFYDAGTGSWLGGVQGADAYAVWVGLDEDGRAMANLVKKFRELDYFDTGFLGTEILVDILTSSGEEDLAYQLLTSEKLGSYSYMKEHGATTIWEDWDGRESHNHPMYGAPARHLFDAFLGIRQPEGTKGYKSIVVAPKIPAALSAASGSTELPSGKVSVSFKNDGTNVEFTVTVPSGVPAEFVYGETTVTLALGENNLTLPFAGNR